jgi:hypothetical protein
MDKQQIYLRYVLNDLVKHAVTNEVSFYFFDEYRVEATPFRLTAFYPNWRDVFRGFGHMLKERYGVRDYETDHLWKRLKIALNEKYYDSPDGSI